jgi:hypothetical protein
MKTAKIVLSEITRCLEKRKNEKSFVGFVAYFSVNKY